MSADKRQPGDTVGDYRLVRSVSEGQLTRTWEAEQLSMQRQVMLEMLKVLATTDAGTVSAFLADVKAKALVSHPQIGAVYEAVTNDEATFFARERLDGKSLEEIFEGGAKLAPVEIVKLLEQISGAMIYLENEGVATVEYDLNHFIVGSNRQIRLMNLAVEGRRDERVATRVKNLLGEAFDGMILQGAPGATRVGSLCGFMADQERQVPLTWGQIQNLSIQVREQLEGSVPVESPVIPPNPYVFQRKATLPPAFWALLGGIVLICGFIALLVFSKENQRPSSPPDAGAPRPFLEIPAGEYPGGGGLMITLPKLIAIARTEVTMAQYNAFLEFPDHSKFEHPDQPASKKDHLPDDWKPLWTAAVKGEKYDDRAMSTDCPVVGVDWWDAYAYAKWEQGRLPTLNEWGVAAIYQGRPNKPAAWGPVKDSADDVTGAGLIGMAGGVREWTLHPEVNPATPLAPKKFVIAGGAFSEAGKGIDSRLWLDSRNVRLPDLGFRIIGRN
jgi:hypothetical protein